MTKLINRFPDFGGQYDQSKMNQLVSLIKQVIGGVEYPELQIAVASGATYTVQGSDGIVNVSRTATGACTITIPLASLMRGRPLIFIDTGNNASANNITLTASGSDTIDGSGTKVMNTNLQRVILWSNGANWYSL